MAQITPEKAPQAAKSRLRFWQAGKNSLARMKKLGQQHPEKVRFGRKGQVLNQEPRREHLNPDTMAKAQRAAAFFSKHQIVELQKLIREHRAPFAAAHLVIVLQVPDGKRLALTREAIRRRWSQRELVTIVRKRFPRTHKGGRRPRVHKDVTSNLADVEATSVRWVRLVEASLPALEESSVSPELLKGLDRASRAAKQVRELVGRELDKIRGGPPPRGK